MLLRHTSQYLLASIVSAFFGLLSTVVFTRLLSPDAYGVYVVGVGAAGVVSAVLFTWVRYAAMRFQSEGGGVDIRATALAAYCISAACAPLAILAVVLTWRCPLEQAICAVVFALGLGLFELGQELLKARQQTGPYVLASIVRCVAAFLACLPVAYLGGSGIGQIAAAASAYFVTSALMARRVWRGPMPPIEWGRLGVFLTLGVSLTLSGFLFACHAALDRLMVAWILGESAAGVYGASADLVRQIILVPAGAVATAAIPLAVHALAQGGPQEARKQLEAGGELLLAVLAPAAIGLALTSPYLVQFVLGSAFRSTALSVIPILAFAWLFQSVTQSYVHLSYHLAKRPGLGTLQSLATLLVNAATLWPLVSRFGLPGAAVSLVVAEGVGAVFGFMLTRYAHPLPLTPAPLLRVAAATGVMALVVVAIERLLPERTLASLAALVIGGVAAYALAALAFNIAQSRTLVSASIDRLVNATAGGKTHEAAPPGRASVRGSR